MAWLNCSEVGQTQIVAILQDLDEEYNGSIRNIVWKCYEGYSASGTLIETVEGTIDNKVPNIYNVFSGLKRNTAYCITAEVSNIQGTDGTILFKCTQRTLESGGTIYPDPDNNFHFDIVASAMGNMISYTVILDNLNTSYYSGYYLNVYKGGNTVTKQVTIYQWFEGDKNNGTDPQEYVAQSGTFEDLSEGEYSLKLKGWQTPENDNDPDINEIDCTVTIEIKATEVHLEVDYVEKAFSGEMTNGGMYYYTCANYPIISAKNFNSFTNSINTLRSNAGMSEYVFTRVSADDDFSAAIFNEIYNAIKEFEEVYDITFPEDFKKLTPRMKFTNSYIKAINVAFDIINEKYSKQEAV